MPVVCPGCATRYSLPSHLLGPSGARICCPACWLTFVLGPDGALTAVLGRSEPADPADCLSGDAALAADGSHAAHLAHAMAVDVLRALDEPPGTLAQAEADGRLFAEHGAALLEAFETLAQSVAPEVMAPAFRDALFDVAGLDLAMVATEPDLSSRPDWHTHG